MNDFKLKLTANNDVVLSESFIAVYFSDQNHTSTAPYHCVFYLNDAIMSLAGLLLQDLYCVLFLLFYHI